MISANKLTLKTFVYRKDDNSIRQTQRGGVNRSKNEWIQIVIEHENVTKNTIRLRRQC